MSENSLLDLTAKSDQQLKNIVDNHRKDGKLNADLAKAAIAERARRVKSFDFKKGIEFLVDAARKGKSVNYRQLAEAGGVLGPNDKWYQHMTRKIPLSQIVDFAHTHDMPALTALVETTQGVTDSILEGFQKGLHDTGLRVPVGMSVREHYLAERQRVFSWAATH